MTSKKLLACVFCALFALSACSDEKDETPQNPSNTPNDPQNGQNDPQNGNVIAGDNDARIHITKLPANDAGSNAWPDGIVAFDIGSKHYFGIAGEASDSLIIVDENGTAVSNTRITDRIVPSDYPCLNDEDFPGVAYSPDSVTAFTLGAKTYLAATLRYSGAAIIFDVSNPTAPVFELITRVGTDDIVGTGQCTGYDNMTKVYPEGITSGVVGNAAYIWVANEYGNSVTSLKIEDQSAAAQGTATGISIKITENITQQYSGNIESVRFVAGRANPSLIAVSSKTRTIHYLEVADSMLSNYYQDYVGTYAQSEYEFTNSAVFDADHTLITLTKPTKTSSGETTACAGELLIIEHNKTDSSGDSKVTSIPVGPMPDAVAISPNKKYAITADEQDSTAAWGKCPLNDGKPGVSIIQIADDSGTLLANPVLLKQIQFTKNELGPREPEYVTIASDNDLVAVTLQDSHEVVTFKLSEVLK